MANPTRKQLLAQIATLEAAVDQWEAAFERIQTQLPALNASVDVAVEHMARCPERGGPLSWRCLGVGHIVGHGSRCVPPRWRRET